MGGEGGGTEGVRSPKRRSAPSGSVHFAAHTLYLKTESSSDLTAHKPLGRPGCLCGSASEPCGPGGVPQHP